jgi:hypothetical protein
VNGDGHGPHAHGVVVSSATDRTPAQMLEDCVLWARAGYPATAVGRYRDAADQLERLTCRANLLELKLSASVKRLEELEAAAHQMEREG